MSATYHIASQGPTCQPGAPACKGSNAWEIQPLYKERRHSGDGDDSKAGNKKASFRG